MTVLKINNKKSDLFLRAIFAVVTQLFALFASKGIGQRKRLGRVLRGLLNSWRQEYFTATEGHSGGIVCRADQSRLRCHAV